MEDDIPIWEEKEFVPPSLLGRRLKNVKTIFNFQTMFGPIPVGTTWTVIRRSYPAIFAYDIHSDPDPVTGHVHKLEGRNPKGRAFKFIDTQESI